MDMGVTRASITEALNEKGAQKGTRWSFAHSISECGARGFWDEKH